MATQINTETTTEKTARIIFTWIMIFFIIGMIISLFIPNDADAQGITLRDPSTGKTMRNQEPVKLFSVDMTPQYVDTTERESAVFPVRINYFGNNLTYNWQSDSLILVYDQNHILKGISFPSNLYSDNLTMKVKNIETGETKIWSVTVVKSRCRQLCEK